MKKQDISKVIDGISTKHIAEAASYTPEEKGKRSNIKSFFINAPVAAAIIFCLLVGSVAYAAVSISNWSSQIRFDDGSTVNIVENAMFKKIPADAPKTEEYGNALPMSLDKVEKALGFNILSYENAENKTVNYWTALNQDGSIARVDLWWPRIVHETISENDERSINQSVYILNVGAENGYVLAFEEGLDAMGEKILLDTVCVEKLDTDVIFYTSGGDSERITATFAYDNVLYDFTGHGYSKEEILAVIEKLK